MAQLGHYNSVSIFGGKDFFTHSTVDSGYLHTHGFFEFSYVVRGSAKHLTLNSETLLTNNSFLIIRPTDAHAFDESNNKSAFHRDVIVSKDLFLECCNYISPTLYDEILNSATYIQTPFSQEDFKSIESSLKFISTIFSTDQNLAKNLGKSVVCYLLFLYVKNKRSESSVQVKKVIDEVLSALQIPDVIQYGIPALIKEVNYSHGHLCRLIKQQTGRKLLDILTESRMEKAALLLRTTDMPLVDIAATVGYESLSHFISVFEKYYSISPFKYRKHFKLDK